MTETIVRKGQTGEPTTNPGEFGSRQRAEATGLNLDPIEMVAGEWEPNTEFAIPQANDLDRVILATRAIRDGADTAEAIATYLDTSVRTGHYYATAAGYLGFMERERDDLGVDSFSLTELGHMLTSGDNEDACRLVGTLVDRMTDVHDVRLRGEAELAGQYELFEGLSTDTAARRAACIASWSNQAMDLARVQREVDLKGDDCRERTWAAIQTAREQREQARRVLAAAAPKTGSLCPSCFTEMSLTGACDTCD